MLEPLKDEKEEDAYFESIDLIGYAQWNQCCNIRNVSLGKCFSNFSLALVYLHIQKDFKSRYICPEVLERSS